MEPVFTAERIFLEDLAEDLEGAFHVIAHAGHEKNMEYIRLAQKEIKDKYEKYFERVGDVEIFFLYLIHAYDFLQEMHKHPPEERAQLAEDGLGLLLDATGLWEDDPLREYFEQN